MKDYHNKKIENPFIKKKNRTVNNKIKKILIYSLFFLLILAIFGLFSYTKYLNITKIRVNGVNRIPIIDIEKLANEQTNTMRFKIFPQKNIFFFNNDLLAKNIKNVYHFQSIKIKKNILKLEILIEINENKTLFILKEGSDDENYYYIDNENYIIKTATSSKGAKYPIIINKTNKLIKDDQVSLDKKYINRVVSFFDLFYLTLEQKIDIGNFIIDEELNGLNNFKKNILKISIKNGPIITFGDKKPIEEIKKLILIKNELRDDFYHKEYINMMYEDRIFSK